MYSHSTKSTDASSTVASRCIDSSVTSGQKTAEERMAATNAVSKGRPAMRPRRSLNTRSRWEEAKGDGNEGEGDDAASSGEPRSPPVLAPVTGWAGPSLAHGN